MASDSVPSTSLETSTSSTDVQCYLIDSTSDIEGAELLSTDMEFLMSSSSSRHSFTSESSSPQFRYTYDDLLDHSPADVNQPQPNEDIYVPNETINKPQLRNPPVVSLQRSVSLNLQSLNNYFFPQPTIDKEEDVTIFNALPDYIEVSSENTDSDATIV